MRVGRKMTPPPLKFRLSIFWKFTLFGKTTAMAAYEVYRIEELEEELQQVKDQMNAKDEKMENLEKELQEMKVQQMDQSIKLAYLEKTNAAKCYAVTLPPPDWRRREIELEKGQHKYRAGIEDFIRHGAVHCRRFSIRPDDEDESKGFFGYPDNFFDDLVKYCYESDKPEEMIGHLVIELPKGKPAPWPKPLVQLHGADFGWVSKEQLKADGVPATLKELQKGDQSIEVEYRSSTVVHYTLRNKHKPEVVIRLRIWFDDGTTIYKQMTTFVIERKA